MKEQNIFKYIAKKEKLKVKVKMIFLKINLGHEIY